MRIAIGISRRVVTEASQGRVAPAFILNSIARPTNTTSCLCDRSIRLSPIIRCISVQFAGHGDLAKEFR